MAEEAKSKNSNDQNSLSLNRITIAENEFFSKSELKIFAETLLKERDLIIQKAKDAVEKGNIQLAKDEMFDEVDLASATIEQNLTFRLLDRDRKLLSEIDHAIKKIETGEFGICEGTGEAIPKRRLELRPWTRHSVKYKEYLEKLKKANKGLPEEDAGADSSSSSEKFES